MTSIRCQKCFKSFEMELPQLPLRDPVRCPLCDTNNKINVSRVLEHAKPVRPSREAVASVTA